MAKADFEIPPSLPLPSVFGEEWLQACTTTQGLACSRSLSSVPLSMSNTEYRMYCHHLLHGWPTDPSDPHALLFLFKASKIPWINHWFSPKASALGLWAWALHSGSSTWPLFGPIHHFLCTRALLRVSPQCSPYNTRWLFEVNSVFWIPFSSSSLPTWVITLRISFKCSFFWDILIPNACLLLHKIWCFRNPLVFLHRNRLQQNKSPHYNTSVSL